MDSRITKIVLKLYQKIPQFNFPNNLFGRRPPLDFLHDFDCSYWLSQYISDMVNQPLPFFCTENEILT